MENDPLESLLARAGAIYRDPRVGGVAVDEELKSRVRSRAQSERQGRRDGTWWWASAGLFAAALIATAILGLFAHKPSAPAQKPPKSPTVLDFLPHSGNYAFPDGYVQRWAVARSGNRLTISEFDSGVSATQPAFVYDLQIKDGCLEQLDVRNTKGVAQAEAFPWYCVPPRSFHDAYDNADYHVVESATESYGNVPGAGRVLEVRVRQTKGGKTYTIQRYFAKGQGLVRETITDSAGLVQYDLSPVSGTGVGRPVRAMLAYMPFGAHPMQMPFGLLAPAGLPFSTYVPLASHAFGPGFSSQSVFVGDARGVLFGDLQHRAMLTEVVFLPKGGTLAQAIASLQKAETAYPKLRFTPDPDMKYAAFPWALREYSGTDPHDPTDLAGADIGRYQGQYFYIVRAGWYERGDVPILSAWRWSDGETLGQGAGKGR